MERRLAVLLGRFPMRIATRKFLRAEIDALQQEAALTRAAVFRVVKIDGETAIDMTDWVDSAERRIARFEEALASLFGADEASNAVRKARRA